MTRLLHVRPNAPALGLEFGYVLPESISQARVVSFIARLTTSAIVDDRVATLQITDRSGNVRLIAPSSVPQAASEVVDYVWGLCGSPYEAGGATLLGGSEVIPLIDCWVQGGDVIRTQTVNMDGGDLWATPYLTIELDEIDSRL